MRRSHLIGIVVALLLAEHVWLWFPALRALVMQHQETAATRGRSLAQELGCFSCHGPDGTGGVPNPGSRWETVPGFREQTIMMFAENDDDVREYILDGAPARKREDESYRNEMAAQALRMPAYRGWVGESELRDLVAYLRSVSGMILPPGGAAARGAELARKYECFTCHGEMGSGGHGNPGALKGYIPGFYGHDFEDLVRSDEELRDWIGYGSIERIREHPIGRFFTERQRVKMPAMKDFLSKEEIEDLAAYIRWLAEESWRDAPLNP